MSTLEIGQKAKLKEGSTRVGKIWDIQDGIAHLTSIRQYGNNENWHAPVEDLIHVCSERPMQGYHSYECGRPAKEGNLCGIHAGVLKRVRKNREREEQARREAIERRTKARLERARMDREITKRDLQGIVTSINETRGTVEIKLDDLLDLLRNA